MWLLAHRGRAWLRRGEQGRARRDLEAALAAAAQYEAKTTDATEIARATTGALLDLTVLAAQEGRVDAALEHAGAALARTRAPEVLGDELWVRKELAPLRDDPRWRALLGR